jgi:hypothetical protein
MNRSEWIECIGNTIQNAIDKGYSVGERQEIGYPPQSMLNTWKQSGRLIKEPMTVSAVGAAIEKLKGMGCSGPYCLAAPHVLILQMCAVKDKIPGLVLREVRFTNNKDAWFVQDEPSCLMVFSTRVKG